MGYKELEEVEEGAEGEEDCRGCIGERTERPFDLHSKLAIDIRSPRHGESRASLELKLITFMSGAMYHYARDLGPRMQLPLGAATRSLGAACNEWRARVRARKAR